MTGHDILHSFRTVIPSVHATFIVGAGMLQDGWNQNHSSFLMDPVTSLLRSALLARAQKCFRSATLVLLEHHNLLYQGTIL